MPAKTKQLEEAEQAALFAWIDALIPAVPALEMIYAVPNGGSRSAVMIKGRRVSLEAMRLKKCGMRPGVYDVAVDIPALDPDSITAFHGMRIEMKHGDNKLSAEQRAWTLRYRRHGYWPVVAYSWTQAAHAIVRYLARSEFVSPRELLTLRRALPWSA